MDFLKRMLLLCCMGFLLLAGNCSGDFDVTNGDGEAGATWCNGKLCAEFASCVNQSCVCDQEPNNHGHGNSGCHTIHDVSAVINNDPHITTFSNAKGNAPVPCRYSFTAFKTVFRPNVGTPGFCRFNIKAFNRKSRGKFYLYGFDVRILVEYLGTNTNSVTRTRGVAENGIYTIQSNTTDDTYDIDGPYRNDDCNSTHQHDAGLGEVVCKIDPVNNVASFDIEGCGVGIKFRPYDTALARNQPMVPGLSVVISRNHTPEFNLAVSNLALAPTFDRWYANFASIPPYFGSITDKMVHKVLKFNVEQNVDYNDKCNSLRNVVSKCSTVELQVAYDRCLWTFETPKFIRCFDNSTNGREIMGLFGDCALTVCGTGNLTQLTQQVASSLCAPTDPHVVKFVALG